MVYALSDIRLIVTEESKKEVSLCHQTACTIPRLSLPNWECACLALPQRYPRLRLCMQPDDVEYALQDDPIFGEFLAR